MAISASLVKQLRERSGAGMMECKKALVECEGNLEEASDFLRKKGLTKASKKSGRDASEGVIALSVSEGKASLLELNCETDFVTKNAQFIDLAKRFASQALNFQGADIEDFKQEKLESSSKTVGEEIVESVMTIGENIQLRRMGHLNVDNGVVAHYIHNSIAGASNLGKIAVVVALETTSKAPEIAEFGKHVAMHVAASNPQSLNIESLDVKLVEKEKNFLKEQALASGKPENVVEKMIEGRIRKFYEEIVLLEQVSMIEGKTKIKDLLAELASKVGATVQIKDFIRFEVGESAAEQADKAAS